MRKASDRLKSVSFSKAGIEPSDAIMGGAIIAIPQSSVGQRINIYFKFTQFSYSFAQGFIVRQSELFHVFKPNQHSFVNITTYKKNFEINLENVMREKQPARCYTRRD